MKWGTSNTSTQHLSFHCPAVLSYRACGLQRIINPVPNTTNNRTDRRKYNTKYIFHRRRDTRSIYTKGEWLWPSRFCSAVTKTAGRFIIRVESQKNITDILQIRERGKRPAKQLRRRAERERVRRKVLQIIMVKTHVNANTRRRKASCQCQHYKR